jgi:RNA polymerase subunit RPABC4/transcription elongation factor Spt4
MIPKEEHCKSCGEWLPDDVDICPTCGMLQVK